ncbi:Spore germination protein B3 precursor [Chlamydia abortus]|nr:Spore germination protein B3 precursor [Chlamydia abortus]
MLLITNDRRMVSLMNRRLSVALVWVFLTILLTSCWSRRELNDLAIQVAVGIDKAGDLYTLTAQVVEPSEVAKKGAGGVRSPVTTYTATGKTLMETYRKMTLTSPRRLYGAHLRMIILSDEIAKEGLNKVMDVFSRDHEFRTDFYIVVAKNTKAENMLKIVTPLEKIPANRLLSSLETAQRYWAPAVGIAMHDLINDLISDGREPVLTALELIGDQRIGETQQNVKEITPEAVLRYAGLAIFKDDRLIGWFDQDNSKGVTYLRKKVKSTVAIIPCPEGQGEITIEVGRADSKMITKLKDGQPEAQVKINIEGSIAEASCSIDLTKRVVLHQLEQLYKESLEKKILTSIRAGQKLGSDVFGFGEEVHRSNPAYWKKNKKDWNKAFRKMPIQVDAKIKLRHSGTIGNPFMKTAKE